MTANGTRRHLAAGSGTLWFLRSLIDGGFVNYVLILPTAIFNFNLATVQKYVYDVNKTADICSLVVFYYQCINNNTIINNFFIEKKFK